MNTKSAFCAIMLAAMTVTAGFSQDTQDQDVQEMSAAEKLFWNKQYAAAEASARQAIEANAEDADAHYIRALSLIELNRDTDANAEIAAARDAGASPDMLNVLAGRVALKGKVLAEAERLCTEALKTNPQDGAAYFYRGMAYATAGDFAKAAADLDRSIELIPTNFLAQYYAGIAYRSIGRPDLMVAHFEQLIRLAPDSEEAAKAQSLLRSVRR